MTEIQQQRLQVCENNWVRKIARVYDGRQAVTAEIYVDYYEIYLILIRL